MKEKLFKGFEKEDGTFIQEAYFDGYNIGDTLMEGVMYKVKVHEDGSLSVDVAQRFMDYMGQFNMNYWLAKAFKYAESNDLFYSSDDMQAEEVYLVPR